MGTAVAKAEEGKGNGRSVCPESPGRHARYKGRDKEFRPREGKIILKPVRSSDRGLQPALVKLDSVVIADQHPAVNMPLLLAHTARQTSEWSFDEVRLFGLLESRFRKEG